MIKQQNIVFNNDLNFNIGEGGIIKKDTEILNLIFTDHSKTNCLCLIGNTLEWIPQVWMEFEQEKIKKLKQLNIVCLMGDLSDFFVHCQQKFNNIEIRYYSFNYTMIKWWIVENTLSQKKLLSNQHTRTQGIYSSCGTMRLNRYILVKEGIDKGYNFYYPKISYSVSKNFEYQISQCLGLPMEKPIELNERRLFGNRLTQVEHNARQVETLSSSYINFVATQPNTDFLRVQDEKYFDTILCKSIPFMLSAKNSNKLGLEILGFLPYEGFEFKNDSDDNYVSRWKLLLSDNEHIFKDLDKIKALYYKNQHVIEHNFDRLVNTDWEKELLAQYNRLPTFIKENIDNRNSNY